jgi:hypothetical protein
VGSVLAVLSIQVRRASVRINERNPGYVGARKFEVELEPAAGGGWQELWNKSPQSVTVGGKPIPIEI